MSEAILRTRSDVQAHAPKLRPHDALPDAALSDAALPDAALPDVIVPIAPFEANDNEEVPTHQQPEARMFEMPARVWAAMVGCYSLFLIALLGATGGAHVALALCVAAIYVAMFFGTAGVMLRHSPPQAPSKLDRPGAVLQTAFGPLGRNEVYAQALIVPVGVAIFGLAIAIISAIVT